MPQDVIEPGLLRLYQSPMKLVTTLVKIGLIIIIFFSLKHWIFTTIYELSGWDFAERWASTGFLFWPVMILAGLAILSAILMWWSTYYEIYPERVVVKRGVLSRHRMNIDMDQFAAVEVNQGIWGRFLGYGDIIFLFEAMTTVITKGGVILAGVRQPDKLVSEAAKYIEEAGPNIRGKVTNKVGLVQPEAKPEVEPVEVEAPVQTPREEPPEVEKPPEPPKKIQGEIKIG